MTKIRLLQEEFDSYQLQIRGSGSGALLAMKCIDIYRLKDILTGA